MRVFLLLAALTLLSSCCGNQPPMPEVGEVLIPYFRTRPAEVNQYYAKFVVYECRDTYFITCSKSDFKILSIWSKTNNPESK